MITTTKRQRIITRCLAIAKLQFDGESDGMYSPELQQEQIRLLESLDARTGKREKHAGPPLVTARKRAARKAR